MQILSDLGGIFTSANYWIGIFSSIVVLFVRQRMKLPRLIVSGIGSGDGPIEDGEQFGYLHIGLTNSPSFFGYSINRDTLNIQYANLFDPVKNVYEGPHMRWRGAPAEVLYCTEIKVGDNADLMIYGIYKQRVHHYVGQTALDIDLSETLVELGQSRKLEIRIFDKLQRCYKIPFKISAEERRNHPHKMVVSIQTKTRFSDRLRQFRSGFADMIRAFTHPNY